jgi:hypothetical protein
MSSRQQYHDKIWRALIACLMLVILLSVLSAIWRGPADAPEPVAISNTAGAQTPPAAHRLRIAAMSNLNLYPNKLASVYVAPHGSPSGNGTVKRPLDLTTALSGRSRWIHPGAAIWLRGGTYQGSFTSNLTGTSQEPIIIRPFPGERAIIDSANSPAPALTVKGAWAIYRGFEITNSNPDRVNSRPNGLMIYGPHTKFINLVVHDTGVGIGLWSPAIDSEVYGCIVYRNGWQGPPPDRGHGHGIYSQNADGTKRIIDNMIFDQFGYGIHNYAQAGDLKGFHIEGNIIFGNGSSARPADTDDPNIFVGGFLPAERVILIDNFTYHPSNRIATNVRLNYSAQNNKDIVLQGNYFAGGTPLIMTEWLQATVTHNTLIGPGGLSVVYLPDGVSPSAYRWDHNTYYTNQSPSASPFIFESRGKSISYTFTDWQRVTGFDRNSQLFRSDTSKPAGLKIFIRPNLYESGRANIAIYNWDGQSTVEVDLGDTLSIGASYEVRNVYDYFGRPVASGIYDGKSIRLPMTGTRTGPEFNAFVLMTIGTGAN